MVERRRQGRDPGGAGDGGGGASLPRPTSATRAAASPPPKPPRNLQALPPAKPARPSVTLRPAARGTSVLPPLTRQRPDALTLARQTVHNAGHAGAKAVATLETGLLPPPQMAPQPAHPPLPHQTARAASPVATAAPAPPEGNQRPPLVLTAATAEQATKMAQVGAPPEATSDASLSTRALEEHEFLTWAGKVLQSAFFLVVVSVDYATAVLLCICWWARYSVWSCAYGCLFSWVIVLRPQRYESPQLMQVRPRAWGAACMVAAASLLCHVVFAILEGAGVFDHASTRQSAVDWGFLPRGQETWGDFISPDVLILCIIGGCGLVQKVSRRQREREAELARRKGLQRRQAR